MIYYDLYTILSSLSAFNVYDIFNHRKGCGSVEQNYSVVIKSEKGVETTCTTKLWSQKLFYVCNSLHTGNVLRGPQRRSDKGLSLITSSD